MTRADEIARALLDHPEHELYDEALPGEIDSVERFLKLELPPSYRTLLQVGSGGILSSGDMLLGTKDPEQLGATLHEVARAAWSEGLPRHLLPFVDGANLLVFDLSARDERGEAPVLELDGESLQVLRRWEDFPGWAAAELL